MVLLADEGVGQQSDPPPTAAAAAELDAEALLREHHTEIDRRPIAVSARPAMRPDDGTGVGWTVCPFCNARAGNDSATAGSCSASANTATAGSRFAPAAGCR